MRNKLAKHTLHIENKFYGPTTVYLSASGEVVIRSIKGRESMLYSSNILNEEGAVQLRDWLNERYPVKTKKARKKSCQSLVRI